MLQTVKTLLHDKVYVVRCWRCNGAKVVDAYRGWSGPSLKPPDDGHNYSKPVFKVLCPECNGAGVITQ